MKTNFHICFKTLASTKLGTFITKKNARRNLQQEQFSDCLYFSLLYNAHECIYDFLHNIDFLTVLFNDAVTY